MEDKWQTGRLGDFADVQTGPFGSQLHKKDYVEIGTPIITVEHLGDNRIVHTNLPRVSEKDRLRLKKYWMKRGDIIFSRVGSVDRRSYVNKKEDGWLFSGRCLRVRVTNEKLDSRFLSFFLGVESVKEHIRQIAVGATMPSLNTSLLCNIEIIIPPLTEQKAIAHILGSLDDKIELNRRMNETLEAMAQALFKSWFVDFDPVIDNALTAGNDIPEELKERADIREVLGDSRKSLPEEIQNLFPSEFEHTEEMGWIPKGWKVSSVESVIEINPTVKLPKNTVTSFVDMKALPTTGYSVGEIIEKPYAGGAKFQNGDVLLARITPCLENGKTAIADFLNGDQIGFGSTEFIILRGQGFVGTPFVACLSRNGKFRDHCIQSMVGSSGRQRVQNACFSNFFLSLPKENDLLKEFHSRTEGSFNKITKHSEQSRVLTNLRDTLLPQLLSGEMRIPEADLSACGHAQAGKLVEGLK